MSTLSASLVLLLTAFLWGVSFVVQKWAVLDPDGTGFGAMSFTGARLVLGALVVLPFAWVEQRAARRLTRDHWLGFCACGGLLLAGMWLQQVGIGLTSITNAGFFTGIYVTLVPPLAWVLFGRKPHSSVWAGMAVCLIGIWLLNGGSLTAFSRGDLWVLVGSLFWAGHVTLVGIVAEASGRPLALAVVQFIVGGVLALGLAGIMEQPTLAVMTGLWREIVWAGAISVGVAFTLQGVGQRYMAPGPAAIILSAEMAFAAIGGAVVFHDRLDPGQWVGAGLIFIAIVAVQIIPLRRDRAEQV